MPLFPPRPPTLVLSALLLAALCTGLRADNVVQLPPITVNDSKILPEPEHWRYSTVQGFEILSSASDSDTRRIIHDLQLFQQAIGYAWPAMAADQRIPGAIILCGKTDQFQTFKPLDPMNAVMGAISVCLRDREQAAIVLDTSSPVLTVLSTDPLNDQSYQSDTSATPQSGFAVDHDRQLHREYMHFLFGRMSPRPPTWLEEGLAQLFMEMKYTPTEIEFGKLDDPKKISAQAAQNEQIKAAGGDTGDAAINEEVGFNTALAHRALMPLDHMFAVERNSAEAQDVIGGLWPQQCACFVHLCLYGYNGKYQQAFLHFVELSDKTPVSEALFEKCFQMNYSKMMVVMRDYLDFASYKSSKFKPHDGGHLPDIPEIALRDASQSEIGRIKGDALRLAGQAEAAHIALITPYIRGERDPELIASIGMDEFATGKADRARKFLEAAAAMNSGRARAYLELAQLRMNAITRGKLTPYALNNVLTPLFVARRLGPPLPEVYEAIAQAWDRSSVVPTAENLAVLDEGVNLFPTDTTLIYSDALLKQQIGADATPLIRLGTVTAADDATRERFARLQSLPSAPAGAPKS